MHLRLIYYYYYYYYSFLKNYPLCVFYTPLAVAHVHVLGPGETMGRRGEARPILAQK